MNHQNVCTYGDMMLSRSNQANKYFQTVQVLGPTQETNPRPLARQSYTQTAKSSRSTLLRHIIFKKKFKTFYDMDS